MTAPSAPGPPDPVPGGTPSVPPEPSGGTPTGSPPPGTPPAPGAGTPERAPTTAPGAGAPEQAPTAAPGAGTPEQAPTAGPSAAGPVPRNRAADRAAVRAFRPRRVVPAVITAALMLVVGGLVATEVISALLGSPVRVVPYDRMFAWAASTPWRSPQALGAATLLTALGLLLVLFALIPGRTRTVPVRTGDPDLIVGMRPRGFTGALAHAANRVPGVEHARVRLVGRTARVTARTTLRDTSGLPEAVRQAVHARIEELSPVHDHPVSVRLRGR